MVYLGPAGPYIPVDPTKIVQDSPAHLRYRQQVRAAMKAQEEQRERIGKEMERKALNCQPFNAAPVVREGEKLDPVLAFHLRRSHL